MQYEYFYDHLFDLLNESDLLDLQAIETIPDGYRVVVQDGSVFEVCLRQRED